jgi:hypothetical protein
MNMLFDLTGAQYAQLIGGLAGGILIYLLALLAPERWIVSALIVLTPFQLISTRYGSLNMILIYVIFTAYIIKRNVRYFPFVVSFSIIIFSYFLSITQSQKSILIYNFLYIFSIIANFLVFFIVYNYFKKHKDVDLFFKCFIIMNLLVSIYCYLSFIPAFNKLTLMGMDVSVINENRSDRMTGPFRSVGLASEYFAMSIIMMWYLALNKEWNKYKLLLYILMGANFGFIVATGNRGGFLVLLGGVVLFWIMFRKSFSITRMFIFSMVGMLFFGVGSMLVIKYTKYNVLFDRLANTTIEGGIPDSRSGPWPLAWENIQRKPIFGHRPRLGIPQAMLSRDQSIPAMGYPHNLYLHILLTTGSVGLMAFMLFFLLISIRLLRTGRYPVNDPFRDNLYRLGLIMLIMFLVDQLKIEFLRFHINHYQNWIFILFGSFIAFADLQKERFSALKKERVS